MSNPEFVVIVLAIVGVVLGGIGIHHRRKANGRDAEPETRPSLVRVLTTEEELRDAVHRAASFERAVADRMRTRARRYEAMVSREPITEISKAHPGHRRLADDSAPRSA